MQRYAADRAGGGRQRHARARRVRRPAPAEAVELATVRLQLQWFPQAQFAATTPPRSWATTRRRASTLRSFPAAPRSRRRTSDRPPTGPEFTLAWVPKVLQARESEAGSDLVNIAQIFQRAGTLSVSWKDSGITSPADFAGKKVGAWGFGNELEVIAAARKEGLEPGVDFTQVTRASAWPSCSPRMDGCARPHTDCVDVAEAMIYNEYAQLLETTNPDTGELYTGRRLQRHQLQRGRDGDAAGRRLGARRVARRRRTTRTSPPVPARLVQGLDLLPRQSR